MHNPSLSKHKNKYGVNPKLKLEIVKKKKKAHDNRW